MLSGRRLFRGDNEAETLYNVLQGPMVPPSKYAHGIPAGVDAVVMHGLERDRSKRYATAREMAVALEKAAPMVTAREVGEWVERIAGEKLRKRAQQLAEIEMLSADGLRVSSRPPPTRPTPEDEVTKPPRLPDDSLADVMPTGGTTSRTLSQPGFVAKRRSLFAVIAGLAALGVLVVVWFVFSSSAGPAPDASTPSTAPEPPPAAAMAEPAPGMQQPAEPAATSVAPAPSAEVSAASSAPSASAAVAPHKRRAQGSKSRPAANDKSGAKQSPLYSRE
jgi:serine/threonine-protein kinase